MKCSELWLRQWVDPKLTREELSHTLTMAGLEVEECVPVAAHFTGVRIGQISHTQKHTEADRLTVCQVDIGEGQPLTIVCGANNVKEHMKVAVATVNAVLPNQQVIQASTIRGMPSSGMLCSARELHLQEESQGILELPEAAPIGQDLRDYLQLDDYIFDLSITPNRGDCLSIRGLAREISALTHSPMTNLNIPAVASSVEDQPTIIIEANQACPRYVGRIIRGITTNAVTPVWLKERLQRSGIRSIHPIVDVTNYVMLELGQPMHAFDLEKIDQSIVVRYSKPNEVLMLLNGQHQTLHEKTLLICDQQKPLAIAGVMGGLDSSVTTHTTDILLESAYFSPEVIAKQRQHYGLISDSAYRFERGVDGALQTEAIERATQLILEIAGGSPGTVVEKVEASSLPQPKNISLTQKQVENVLGLPLTTEIIETTLLRLIGFRVTPLLSDEIAWQVEVPTYRSDITLPEDLIEEIARLYGYDHIPIKAITAELQALRANENQEPLVILKQGLMYQGFQEIISYSFISSQLQALLDPQEKPYPLLNPINADMAVMRTNLWPGLINVLLHNKSRQQHRIRLFEAGTCFLQRSKGIEEQTRVAGLITGLAAREQWGISAREADFYDLKGHLQNLLGQFFPVNALEFRPSSHPALHPGKTASIYYQDIRLGLLGDLHPNVRQALDLSCPIFIFEIELDQLKDREALRAKEVSKFPESRRDIAILVDQTIPAKEIQDTIMEIAGDWLKDVFLFDLYQGKGITSGRKSVALALIWQHPSRTLIDEEVAELMGKVIAALQRRLGAELRS